MKAVKVFLGIPAILADCARDETGDEVGTGDEAVEVGVAEIEVAVEENVGEGAEMVVAKVIVANERAVVTIGLTDAREMELGSGALDTMEICVLAEEASREVEVKSGERNTGNRDSLVLEFVLGNVRFKRGVWVMLKNPDEKVELESIALESCTCRKKTLLDDSRSGPVSTTQE